MNKLVVFISSRVQSTFNGLDFPYRLTDLRLFLQNQLESQKFLGEHMIKVVINENSFDSDFSTNGFDNCLKAMRPSNIILILYNGEAGWSLDGNGICHDEFLLAMQELPGMTYAINLSHFFTPSQDKREAEKNERFQLEIRDTFRHMESIYAETVAVLETRVLCQVKRYILDAIRKSLETRKLVDTGSSVFGPTLDWSKLSYPDRQSVLLFELKKRFEKFPPFEGILKTYNSIPDNMSVAEARNLIGRPFLYEHELLSLKNSEDKGVIHMVAVYGNATEVQVKNLVGYPDVTVIKTPFGFYLWEKSVSIQMFFLVRCINPSTLGTRTHQLIHWLKTSREEKLISDRARVRFYILNAIQEARIRYVT